MLEVTQLVVAELGRVGMPMALIGDSRDVPRGQEQGKAVQGRTHQAGGFEVLGNLNQQ